jgi:rhodanese-related sulfurtransferase
VLAAAVSVTSAHTEITPAEARAMIAADETLIVLDVRETLEFCGANSHLEDAINFPWIGGVLELRYGELPADADIIVACATGSRSHQAANYLDSQGFSHVFDMEGGMAAWEWEREACDEIPMVRLGKTSAGVEINWTPAPGVIDYDLLRGSIDDLAVVVLWVDLGPTDCLADDSPFTYLVESDPLDVPRFYLARIPGGSWGASSDGLGRYPGGADCE